MKRFPKDLKKNFINWKNCQKGASLVEVMVAFFIIALIATAVIQTTRISLRALEINKARTIAVSIANEEIEKIRAMDYEDIGLDGGDPSGTLTQYFTNSDGYTVYYDITWVNGQDSLKQIAVRVSNDVLQNDIEVVTQIAPEIGT
jgi:Tfp pilus assembly protein PilV